VQLDELPGERQPEPRAFVLAGGADADLTELLEDRPLVFRCDADAGVADGDFDGTVGRRRSEPDPPAGGGELDRVGEEVEDDLLDLSLVANGGAEAAVDGEVEGDAVAGGGFADQGPGGLEGDGVVG